MISTWNIHRSNVTTHQISYFFPFVKQTHPARFLDCEAVPIHLPNLSLSVIKGGGSRFLPLFAIKACSCNAVTLFWCMAGPSLDMGAAPVHYL